MKKIFKKLLFLLLLAGCTRTAQDSPLQDAGVNFGPINKDAKLSLSPISAEKMRASLSHNRNSSTKDYFRIVENLHELAKIESNESIATLSSEMYEAFYKNSANYTVTSFPKSIYMRGILGEGEIEIQQELSSLSKQLKQATGALNHLLETSVNNYPWPRNISEMHETINIMDNYVEWLTRKIPEIGIKPELGKPVISAIRKEYGEIRPSLARSMNDLASANSFSLAIRALNNGLSELKIKLTGEQAIILNKGADLANKIETMESSQDALTLIIQVWRLVPARAREQAFKKEAPELYDFLNGKSESELNCLEASICLNPILEVARRIAILPKINSYGVEKIKEKIDQAALAYLLKTTKETLRAMLPRVPLLVKNKIAIEVNKYQSLINKVQSNLAGFVNKNVSDWSNKNFDQPIRGLEIDQVSVKFSGRNNISISPGANSSRSEKTVSTGAATIGMSLSLAQNFLPSDSARLNASLSAPLMKILAITGFRQYGGKTFPGFNLSIDGRTNELFDVKNLLQGKTTFSVPDSFLSDENFLMDRRTAKKNISIEAQAELLRGISKQIKFHRDWEKNIFDSSLGKIQVEDLASEIPRGSIDFPLFSKEIIFSLSLGSAGGILQNIIQSLSPAFLLISESEILWGNDYEKISEGKVSTVAGLVDIINGSRGSDVKTADIARYALALNEFLLATEHMEETRAPMLLKIGADGKSILDHILRARKYLKLLQMGLTNFLIYKAQEKDGGMISAFHFNNGVLEKVQGPQKLEDQILSIRAILASSNVLGIKLYQWAVLDTYYFLNKKMWNKEMQFYAGAIDEKGAILENASLLEISSALRALKEIEPLLDAESRIQNQKITAPWIKSLESL